MGRAAATVALVTLSGCSVATMSAPIAPADSAMTPQCEVRGGPVAFDGIFGAVWGVAGLAAALDESEAALPLLGLAVAHGVSAFKGGKYNQQCSELHEQHATYIAALEATPEPREPAPPPDAVADTPAPGIAALESEPEPEPEAAREPQRRPRANDGTCPASDCMESVFWREIDVR